MKGFSLISSGSIPLCCPGKVFSYFSSQIHLISSFWVPISGTLWVEWQASTQSLQPGGPFSQHFFISIAMAHRFAVSPWRFAMNLGGVSVLPNALTTRKDPSPRVQMPPIFRKFLLPVSITCSPLEECGNSSSRGRRPFAVRRSYGTGRRIETYWSDTSYTRSGDSFHRSCRLLPHTFSYRFGRPPSSSRSKASYAP